MIQLVSEGISSLKTLGIAQEVTLVQEERSRHFHIWIFPRHEWMDAHFSNSATALREIMGFAKLHHKTSADIQKILDTVKVLKERLAP